MNAIWMIDESIVYYTIERVWQITVLSNIVNSRYRGVDWLAVDGIRCLLLAPPPLTIHNRKCITIQQQFTLYRWYTSSLIIYWSFQSWISGLRKITCKNLFLQKLYYIQLKLQYIILITLSLASFPFKSRKTSTFERISFFCTFPSISTWSWGTWWTYRMTVDLFWTL